LVMIVVLGIVLMDLLSCLEFRCLAVNFVQ
jgi:hypothetical protein